MLVRRLIHQQCAGGLKEKYFKILGFKYYRENKETVQEKKITSFLLLCTEWQRSKQWKLLKYTEKSICKTWGSSSSITVSCTDHQISLRLPKNQRKTIVSNHTDQHLKPWDFPFPNVKK